MTAVVIRERDRSTISGADDAPKQHETASVRVSDNQVNQLLSFLK